VIETIAVPERFQRSDENLAQAILTQLNLWELEGGEFIEVQVKDGIVELRGTVYSAAPKAYAAGAVWAISGVRDLTNRIVIHQRGLETEFSTGGRAQFGILDLRSFLPCFVLRHGKLAA
jgi:hypothetical protein